jgi:hypothetical protein
MQPTKNYMPRIKMKSEAGPSHAIDTPNFLLYSTFKVTLVTILMLCMAFEYCHVRTTFWGYFSKKEFNLITNEAWGR